MEINRRHEFHHSHTLFIWKSIDNSPEINIVKSHEKNLEPYQINRVKVKIERSANLRAE